MTSLQLSLLSQKEIQEFIRSNETIDERELVLREKALYEVPVALLADQIAGLRKAKSKLPEFYKTSGTIYPPSINMEQCSSEITARLKAKIIAKSTTKTTGADLTGGFGVDSYYLSKVFNEFEYVEPDEDLARIATYNHGLLKAENIHHTVATAGIFIKNSDKTFGFAFMDPSRRSGSKKVFRLIDCSPNPVELLPSILERFDKILIKTSPLLDLQQGINELKCVEKIFIVAVGDECKEVLFLCSKEGKVDASIQCFELSPTLNPDPFRDLLSFRISEERDSNVLVGDLQEYLYEPNASLLKAGAFKLLSNRFGIAKVNINTHLYTSDKHIPDFPGRVFKTVSEKLTIEKVTQFLPNRKANIIVRNYPLSPDEIKKKYKLKDGGDRYVIGFTGKSSKQLIVATRLK